MQVKKFILTSAFLSLLLICGCTAKRLPSGESMKDVFQEKTALKVVEAAIDGKRDDLTQIIESAKTADPRGLYGITPLWWTIWVSDFRAFQRLLEMGAKADLNNERYPNAVELAAMNKDERFLKLLIKSKVNLNVVNPRTGESPIFAALMNMQLGNVRMLLQADARIDLRDREGNDFILRAAQLNQYDLVYELLTTRDVELIKNNYGTGLPELLERGNIDPASPQHKWKEEVQTLLRQKGRAL